jgi:hypothetical protein
VGAAPPTRSELRLQRQTVTHAIQIQNGCHQYTLSPCWPMYIRPAHFDLPLLIRTNYNLYQNTIQCSVAMYVSYQSFVFIKLVACMMDPVYMEVARQERSETDITAQLCSCAGPREMLHTKLHECLCSSTVSTASHQYHALSIIISPAFAALLSKAPQPYHVCQKPTQSF